MAEYVEAAKKAVSYLEARLLNEQWVAEHDDVAYYFKAPLAFWECGNYAAAKRAFELVSRYTEKGGAGSANVAYSSYYPHYPLLWIMWGGSVLGNKKVTERAYDNLLKFANPATFTGYVSVPYSNADQNGEADLFATAGILKASLLAGQVGNAQKVASVLSATLEANQQHMSAGKFYLRWKEPVNDDSLPLIINDAAFYCVSKESGALYFMIAYPAMVLLEFASLTKNSEESSKYRSTALSFLAYLKDCKGIFESPWAHKFGRAAAMAGDGVTARKVADLFVTLQRDTGCFQDDPEALDSVDQTAEIATWLFQIAKDLENPPSKV